MCELHTSVSAGLVPQGWEVRRLEQMIEVLDHMRVPISAGERSKRLGTVPYYGANGQQGWIDDYLFDEPLVLIAEDGGNFDDFASRPIAYKISQRSWVNNHAHILRAKNGNNIDFIFFTLAHRDIRRYIAGSTRSKLTQRELRSIEVLTPSSPAEQSWIATVLNTVDEAIAKTEAVIAKLKQMRAGLLRDLLTRGLDENGQLRNPVAHPEQFQDSPLGRIPRDWKCRTLQDAAEWFSGGTPNRSQSSWWIGNVPLLTPKDMKVFELSDTSEHVSDEAVQVGSKLMLEKTVFIVVRGMILAHTFPVCISTRPFGFNQDVKAVRGRAGLTNYYLGHWFAANSALFLRKATAATHGTKKLDSDELYRVYIGVPPSEEQQEIGKRIEVIDLGINLEHAKKTKLSLIKSGLMTDVLTGRVRVPDGIAVTG